MIVSSNGLTINTDSHTATHGAFGALAFGIGTSEVEHVLATQTLLQKKSKNMRILVQGTLGEGVTSKDMILHIIGVIGTAGGTGHVIEFAGSAVELLSMEARMSVCNMAIEAGARAGMVAPGNYLLLISCSIMQPLLIHSPTFFSSLSLDDITFEYLKDRPLAPTGQEWERAVDYWRSLRSDDGAVYDKEVVIQAADISPTVTWGTSPQDVVSITANVPDPATEANPARRAAMERSLTVRNC
jgi:3-isopropylmalate dehydratase